MTRDDWLCPVCKKVMVLTESKYHMTCLTMPMCGKLHPRWRLVNLPAARGLDGKRRVFEILSYSWIILSREWEYVPHGHKTALDKAPAKGHVVASVAFRGKRAVRLFKKKGSSSQG